METNMAQRVPFPADVCPEPDAKAYRTPAEAFPCGPREAVAVQRFEPPKVWRWVLLALLVLGIGAALAGCDARADAEQPLMKAELGATKACGKGLVAVWTSATEMECFKERL